LAVDRANERIADLFEPLSPAVLRQIKAVVDAAHWEGIPVSICGEMAGEPFSAILFIGMGVDELSMGPGALLEMKRLVRGITFEDARRCAREAIAMPTAREINAWVRKSFEGKLANAGLPRVDARY
jgi:phosphoenolpyruvate-protein kinase (PTS system EI component)